MSKELNEKKAIVTGADGPLAAAAADVLEAAGATVERIDTGAALAEACRGAIETLGGVDILVTHSSPATDGPAAELHEIAAGPWNEAIDRHATSVFTAIQTVAPAMQASGGGRIVNLTTARAHSCADQHGVAELLVHGFTVGFARELGGDGVTVNAVEVGAILAIGDERGPDPYPNRAVARAGTATDPAALVELLAGPGGEWISGQVFTVDGGGWMRPD